MRRLASLAVLMGLVVASCATDQISEGADLVTTTQSTTLTSLDTTTTVASGVLDYAEWSADVAAQALHLGARGSEINASWSSGAAAYAVTVEALTDLQSETESLAAETLARSTPDECQELATSLTTATSRMSEEAEAMIAGLESSDDGSARRQALEAFGNAQEDLEDAVVAFHREHRLEQPPGPAPTPTTSTSTTSTSTSTTSTTSAPTTTTMLVTTTTQSQCHPSYTGACVPIGVSDVDCAGGSGNGPYYVGRVGVVGPDEYGLDRDNDGVGCE